MLVVATRDIHDAEPLDQIWSILLLSFQVSAVPTPTNGGAAAPVSVPVVTGMYTKLARARPVALVVTTWLAIAAVLWTQMNPPAEGRGPPTLSEICPERTGARKRVLTVLSDVMNPGRPAIVFL